MNEVTSFITADSLALLIAATLNAGTVVALAALGLLLNERAGVLNLGAEGMMLVAAIAGFATAVGTGSPVLGLVAGIAAGAALAVPARPMPPESVAPAVGTSSARRRPIRPVIPAIWRAISSQTATAR